MPLSQTHQDFIKQIEGASLLDGRYTHLKCVNMDDTRRRGVLSLVFQAFDNVENNSVAIKFFDPERLGNKYRLAAFEREPKILEALDGKKRCLQLKQDINLFPWTVNLSGSGAPIKIDCAFFVTEWIEEDIDEYFFEQEKYIPEIKLRIFRHIVLAVLAIHDEKISHRDGGFNDQAQKAQRDAA